MGALDDGMQVFSVYDFINLVCQKNGTYSRQVWKRLISEDSKFKDEFEFTMVYLKLQNVTLSHTQKRRTCRIPVMTLRGLQRLLMILGSKVAARRWRRSLCLHRWYQAPAGARGRAVRAGDSGEEIGA